MKLFWPLSNFFDRRIQQRIQQKLVKIMIKIRRDRYMTHCLAKKFIYNFFLILNNLKNKFLIIVIFILKFRD